MSTEGNNLDNTATIYHVAVDWSGRIRLSAALRRRFGIRRGDKLTIASSRDDMCVLTLDQSIKAAQERFRSLAPADVLLSEELIKKRREEARREGEEFRVSKEALRTDHGRRSRPRRIDGDYAGI